MFELFIATVLVDGSEHEVALSVASLLEFERLHTVSIIKAIDDNLSMEYLVTLSYLAMKQEATCPTLRNTKQKSRVSPTKWSASLLARRCPRNHCRTNPFGDSMARPSRDAGHAHLNP
jgi:hypothetical protein